MKKLSLLLVFALGIIVSYAQNQINLIENDPLATVFVKKTEEKVTLDGELTEAIWQNRIPAQNFSQYIPVDSMPALGKTEIYMAYDDKNLYVAVKCYSIGDKYIINSLKRDYGFFGSDNVALMFDSFGDKNNAFMFGMNPYGVRREALVFNGGRQRGDFSMSWDNKWKGGAKAFDDYWIAEFAIPFSTLRFNAGAAKWRFNCYRFDTQLNEVSTWTRIPRNRIIADVGYMGEMVWEEPLKAQKRNVSIIPYATGNAIRDFENVDETQYQTSSAIGGDAKISLTSGLNLDLTINPDFSQVEVDRQVTNLSRFEIFFPERRQFFLENADLFSSFGAGRITPFFSRRIGVAVDTATGVNVQNQILYGARLSGKLNNRLRVGLMNIQTAAQVDNDLPGFNYTVAAVEQNVFDRSSIAAILVNKQAINPDGFGNSFNDYNRTLGLEYRMATKDNKWNGKLAYHHIFSPAETEHNFFHMGMINYNVRKFRLEWAHLFVGEGYQPEVGFVTRRDMLFLSPEAEINIFPKNSKITRHTIGFDARQIYKIGKDDNEVQEGFGWIETNFEPFWSMNFLSTARLNINVNYQDLLLLDDFDPTRLQADTVYLAAGTRHRFTTFGMSYSSNASKAFSGRLEPTIGSFYNGFRAGLNSRITYRFQPYGTVSMNVNYNYVALEAPFVPTNLWLVGPRFDLTFSKTVFLTTFVQYNNQQDNLNINARFQWRFQPVSDFFLVYTDNYITDPFDQFAVRNRAIVAKLTYWINI